VAPWLRRLWSGRRRQEAAALSATEQLLRTRAQLARTILRAETQHALCEELCRQCVGAGDIHMAWVGEVVDGHLRPVAWAGDGAREYAQDVRVDVTPGSPYSMGPSGQAFKQRALVICDDYASDPRTRQWRAAAARFGVRSSAALPLRRGDSVIGVLNLYARRSHAFTAALQELLGELLEDVAQGLDHVSRFAEHARLKQEAEENLLQMRQVFDLLPAFVVIMAPWGGFLEVNSYACDFFGLPRERILGKTVRDLGMGIIARDRDAVLSGVEATGRARNVHTQLVGADGRVIDIVTNITRIQYHGEPANLNVSIDVTDRNRAFEMLAESERRLAELVESAKDAIISVDTHGKVVVFNQAAAAMFGVSKEEALGQPLARFLPETLRDAHADYLAKAFASGLSSETLMGRNRTIHARRADATEFPVDATVSIVGEGEQRTATVIMRDMSVFVRAEQARVAALQASAVAAARAAFFSRMSHELRTPLTAVLGYSQLLADRVRGRLDAGEYEQLEHVLHAGRQLRSLVDDILSLSQVQAGRLKLTLQAVNVAEMLGAVRQMCLPDADQHGVTLTLDPPQDPSTSVHTDPLRLQQVLLNLVSNAVKYNRPGGRVRLGSERLDHLLRLSVSDNGLGMSREQLAKLFEPFNRLGRERSGVEGTGLGLALVRELVELLGGSVRVNSTEGVGTQVHVALPLFAHDVPELAAESATEPAATESPSDVHGVVLCIEDSEINAMLITELFKRIPGARLELAGSGTEGLSRARALAPDLILLDMHLPDMHGCDVLNALRREPPLGKVPVVALSASAMQEDVDAAMAAGANAYWTKPIEFENFVKGVRRYLSRADVT
jgi:PAS domain S-box-containing protein